MITSDAMYRKACRVLADLESRAKAGTATDAERTRLEVVRDHVLIHEWATDGTPAVERMPPLPEEPTQQLDPRVVAFCDWWERVHMTPRWRPDYWRVGLLYWWHPHGLESLTWEIKCDVEDELEERDRALGRAA
jgi:hypothetical protein